MTIDLDAIEAAARAATPGHWERIKTTVYALWTVRGEQFNRVTISAYTDPDAPETDEQVCHHIRELLQNLTRLGRDCRTLVRVLDEEGYEVEFTDDDARWGKSSAPAALDAKGARLPFPRSKLGALACAAGMLERDGTPSRAEIAVELREIERALSAIPLSDDAQEVEG